MRTVWSFPSRHGQVCAAVALFVIASVLSPVFLTPFNLSAIAFQYSVIGLIVLGQFAVILTGGIDLSQGSVIGLSAVVAAIAAQSLGLWFSVPAALLVGLVAGTANALLISFTGIPAFIVTLGSMSIARGLALTVSAGQPIPLIDPSFMAIARMRFLEVPVVFIVFLVCAAALSAFLSGWPAGRGLYAVGGHEENARLTGLNIPRIKATAFILSGLSSSVAGLLLTSRLGTGHPTSGTGYELISISAVIIGGASLFGGVGKVSSVVASVLMLGILDSSINLVGISPYLQGTIKGAVVLIALSFSQLQLRRGAL